MEKERSSTRLRSGLAYAPSVHAGIPGSVGNAEIFSKSLGKPGGFLHE